MSIAIKTNENSTHFFELCSRRRLLEMLASRMGSNRDSNLHGYTVHQLYQIFSSPTNAHVEFIKTKLKLGRLLQHVSVYKETIIREPVSA